MFKLKKHTAILLAIILILPLTSFTASDIAQNGAYFENDTEKEINEAARAEAWSDNIPFTDIKGGMWYTDSVKYVCISGLMKGTAADTFSPDMMLSRAQLITILWRMAGEPYVNYAMQFDDIKGGMWYTEAIRFAAAEKITDRQSGNFEPDNAVTREETAELLWNYAKYKRADVSVGEDTNILSYDDFDEITKEYIPAMQWAVGAGIIQGTAAAALSPKGLLTRAQAATMIRRFASGTNGEDDIFRKIAVMTLRDKTEQMLVVDCSMAAYGKDGEKDVGKLSDYTKSAIENHNFGGMILLGDNTKGTKQTFDLVKGIQKAATEDNTKHKIPLFVCVDQEGGRVSRLATGTSMPGNMALGAINDYSTAKEYASVIGSELKALGINVDFAPVVDVNNNPSNPIIGVRSFSSDTKTVSTMAEAFIEGLQNQGIASSLKHFPGHGDTATDSHTGLPMINKTYDDIKACELIPFKAGIDKGVDMVMTAHIVYPQIETTKYISKKTGEEITLPATMSKTILTDILRGDLGYDGIIITDALNMSAIAEHYDKKDVAKYAINAGVDLILMPASLTYENGEIDAYIDMVEELVRSGEVRESDIDESVYRILRLKQKMGILNENNIKFTKEDLAYALKTVGSKEHHDKEFEIAKDAVTLVKGGELLPLDKNGKVMFLNPIVNGENSIEYAIRILKEKGVTGALSYETVNFKDDNVSELKKRIDSAETVVILADTVKNSYFNNNDKSGWQGRFIDKAIEEAHKQNKKVILISCMLPYDAARYGDADAVLCVYGDRALAGLPIIYDGETVTFGANIPAAIFKLFSSEKFKASLPVDIYKTDGDYNYTKEVAFDMNR